jgi:hypothetical protein
LVTCPSYSFGFLSFFSNSSGWSNQGVAVLICICEARFIWERH